MKTIKLTMLTILMSFYSAVLLAAAPGFQTVDANGDKALSTTEISKAFKRFNFASADKDGNGSINEQEYVVAVKEQNPEPTMMK